MTWPCALYCNAKAGTNGGWNRCNSEGSVRYTMFVPVEGSSTDMDDLSITGKYEPETQSLFDTYYSKSDPCDLHVLKIRLIVAGEITDFPTDCLMGGGTK